MSRYLAIFLGGVSVGRDACQERTVSSFLRKVRKTIDRYAMVAPGEKVVVGVSGGLDSMSLLECLYLLKKELDISLIVAHLDHGLRGSESRQDYVFVQEQAAKYGVPFEGGTIPRSSYRHGSSLQDQARTLRYEFFMSVLQKYRAHKIAQAHHRDDHIETLLMRILRGAGSGGLRGIPAVRQGIYIRPFIEMSRKEIEGFCRVRNIAYVEDSSNREDYYTRNIIRHRILPFIEHMLGIRADIRSLTTAASILGTEDELLEHLAGRCLEYIVDEDKGGDEVVLRRSALCALHPALERRVLRMAFMRVSGTPYGPSFEHIESLRRGARSTKRPHLTYCLPAGTRVFLEYDRIRFCKKDIWAPIQFDVVHPIGSETYIPEIGLTIRSRRVSHDAFDWNDCSSERRAVLSFPQPYTHVRVRNTRPGDRFIPLGCTQPKKVKEFFIDHKIPMSERMRTAVLDVEGNVAWLVGIRTDDRYKVTPGSAVCVEFRVDRGYARGDARHA